MNLKNHISTNYFSLMDESPPQLFDNAVNLYVGYGELSQQNETPTKLINQSTDNAISAVYNGSPLKLPSPVKIPSVAKCSKEKLCESILKTNLGIDQLHSTSSGIENIQSKTSEINYIHRSSSGVDHIQGQQSGVKHIQCRSSGVNRVQSTQVQQSTSTGFNHLQRMSSRDNRIPSASAFKQPTRFPANQTNIQTIRRIKPKSTQSAVQRPIASISTNRKQYLDSGTYKVCVSNTYHTMSRYTQIHSPVDDYVYIPHLAQPRIAVLPTYCIPVITKNTYATFRKVKHNPGYTYYATQRLQNSFCRQRNTRSFPNVEVAGNIPGRLPLIPRIKPVFAPMSNFCWPRFQNTMPSNVEPNYHTFSRENYISYTTNTKLLQQPDKQFPRIISNFKTNENHQPYISQMMPELNPDEADDFLVDLATDDMSSLFNSTFNSDHYPGSHEEIQAIKETLIKETNPAKDHSYQTLTPIPTVIPHQGKSRHDDQTKDKAEVVLGNGTKSLPQQKSPPGKYLKSEKKIGMVGLHFQEDQEGVHETQESVEFDSDDYVSFKKRIMRENPSSKHGMRLRKRLYADEQSLDEENCLKIDSKLSLDKTCGKEINVKDKQNTEKFSNTVIQASQFLNNMVTFYDTNISNKKMNNNLIKKRKVSCDTDTPICEKNSFAAKKSNTNLIEKRKVSTKTQISCDTDTPVCGKEMIKDKKPNNSIQKRMVLEKTQISCNTDTPICKERSISDKKRKVSIKTKISCNTDTPICGEMFIADENSNTNLIKKRKVSKKTQISCVTDTPVCGKMIKDKKPNNNSIQKRKYFQITQISSDTDTPISGEKFIVNENLNTKLIKKRKVSKKMEISCDTDKPVCGEKQMEDQKSNNNSANKRKISTKQQIPCDKDAPICKGKLIGDENNNPKRKRKVLKKMQISSESDTTDTPFSSGEEYTDTQKRNVNQTYSIIRSRRLIEKKFIDKCCHKCTNENPREIVFQVNNEHHRTVTLSQKLKLVREMKNNKENATVPKQSGLHSSIIVNDYPSSHWGSQHEVSRDGKCVKRVLAQSDRITLKSWASEQLKRMRSSIDGDHENVTSDKSNDVDTARSQHGVIVDNPVGDFLHFIRSNDVLLSP